MLSDKLTKLLANPLTQALLVGALAAVSALAVWLYFRPFLSHPALNLIDDGYSVLRSEKILHADSISEVLSSLSEPQVGRFRPSYLLWLTATAAIFGTAPAGWWWVQLFTLLSIWWLLWMWGKIQSAPWHLGWLAGLCLLLFPSTAENFFRLGTTETRQALLWLVMLVGGVVGERRRWGFGWMFVWWIAALGMKESSIVILPLLLCYVSLAWWQKYRSLKQLVGWSSLLLITAAVWWWLRPPAIDYASGYSITGRTIWLNLQSIRRGFPELFALVGWAVTLWGTTWWWVDLRRWQEELWRQRWVFLTGGLCVASVVISLPWPYQLDRYYFPSLVMALAWLLSIFPLLPNLGTVKTIATQKNIWKLGTLALFVLVMYVSFSIIVINRTRSLRTLLIAVSEVRTNWFTQYQYSYALISYLQTLPADSQLVVTHPDLEVIYEIWLYASHFDTQPTRAISEVKDLTALFGSSFEWHESIWFESTRSGAITIGRGEKTATKSGKAVIKLWPTVENLRDESQVWWHSP